MHKWALHGCLVMLFCVVLCCIVPWFVCGVFLCCAETGLIDDVD